MPGQSPLQLPAILTCRSCFFSDTPCLSTCISAPEHVRRHILAPEDAPASLLAGRKGLFHCHLEMVGVVIHCGREGPPEPQLS